MRRSIVCCVTLAALAAGLAGCKSDSMKSDSMMSGSKMDDGMMTVATASPGKDVMMSAPMDGEYMLVSQQPGSRPMLTVSLKKGDTLGFKTMPGGSMMAMAGDQKMDVTDKPGVMWVHGMAR